VADEEIIRLIAIDHSDSVERLGLAQERIGIVLFLQSDIEGRVIFDVEDGAAMKVACTIAGTEMDADPQTIRETVAELANLVIGNAVTTLNDQGFRFKVHPPIDHPAPEGFRVSEDIEVLVMDFSSPAGSVVMNIAMRYNRRRRADNGPR